MPHSLLHLSSFCKWPIYDAEFVSDLRSVGVHYGQYVGHSELCLLTMILLTMLVIAINRYMAVVRPEKVGILVTFASSRKQSQYKQWFCARNVAIAIVVIWIGAIVDTAVSDFVAHSLNKPFFVRCSLPRAAILPSIRPGWASTIRTMRAAASCSGTASSVVRW